MRYRNIHTDDVLVVTAYTQATNLYTAHWEGTDHEIRITVWELDDHYRTI